MQHVDPDSADLLRFALHLAPPALRVVAVETPEPYGEAHDPYGEPHRSEDPHARHLWVPSEADVLRVPPLHADEIAELLIHHRLPSRMAGRIHRASGGNPRLALAVGRSLADARTPVHHAEALTLSGRARDLARQLWGRAPAVRETLLLAALALRPSATLVRRAGRPNAEADLAAAERADLVSLAEDGSVTFTAGLLPSTLVHDACWAERSAGHAALAEVVDDPVEAVRHRALATDSPDEELAAEVAAAADLARRRGNSALAAELALLAAESTPGRHGTRRIARLVDAAEEAARAARADLAMRAATDLLARDAVPADRVRARLAVLDTAGQGLTGLDEMYVHAMEDSEGDTALRAAVQLRLALKYVLADGDPERSRTAAVESAALAASMGDPRTASQALTVQARMERALGSPDAESVLDRARALELAERPLGIRNAAQILTIRHALFDDRLVEARDELGALLPLVQRRGSVEDAIELFRTLAEIESRIGPCGGPRPCRAVPRPHPGGGLSPGPPGTRSRSRRRRAAASRGPRATRAAACRPRRRRATGSSSPAAGTRSAGSNWSTGTWRPPWRPCAGSRPTSAPSRPWTRRCSAGTRSWPRRSSRTTPGTRPWRSSRRCGRWRSASGGPRSCSAATGRTPCAWPPRGVRTRRRSC